MKDPICIEVFVGVGGCCNIRLNRGNPLPHCHKRHCSIQITSNTQILGLLKDD